MVTFTIAAIIVSVFFVSVVAISMYIRPTSVSCQSTSREPEQDLHDAIFAHEIEDERFLLTTHR
jgi:hypothetical protein